MAKWLQGAVHPSKKGMFNGKPLSELEAHAAKLRKSGPHKKGSPEYTKLAELNFAIRAKRGHGFGEGKKKETRSERTARLDKWARSKS